MSSSGKVVTLPVPPRRAAAARLRRLRALTGWSQEETARRAGIGVRTLRDLESGRARMTALEALVVLGGAKTCGLVPHDDGGKTPLSGATGIQRSRNDAGYASRDIARMDESSDRVVTAGETAQSKRAA